MSKVQNRVFILLIVSALTSAVPTWSQTARGSAHIVGVLAAEDGSPLVSATVVYTRLVEYLPLVSSARRPVEAPNELYVHESVIADRGGRFDIPGLPSGNYLLCVDDPMGRYLDPCKWSMPISVGGLSGAEARDVKQIHLREGGILTIHVNDPAALLSPVDDLIVDPGIIVGVQTKAGMFYRATQKTKGQFGRDYQIAVPYDVPLGLWLFSRTVSIADEIGNKIDSAGSLRWFEMPTGVLARTVTVSVTGPL